MSLLGSKPFYFNYTNSLLPAKYIITDSWGYGGYEAAQAINQMSNSKNMKIWSDYNGVCVFFNGECNANILTMKNTMKMNEKKGRELKDFDYFVTSRRGSNLAGDFMDELKYQYGSEKISSFEIGGRPQNSISIYRNK
jgi:hypothetical protein